jgi:hypothetical protein
MKKRISFLIMGLAISGMVLAQVPNSFKYQAVARNSSGEVLANQSVSFKVSILQGSASGGVVFSETHNISTNEFGLVSLDIGKGSISSGSIAGISWGDNRHFLKVELDPTGGTSYQYMGTAELLSVPYAMHARTVENDMVEDADPDPGNEIQVLSLDGNDLSLSLGGGMVELPTGADNWGSQTAVTDDQTLTGLGIESNPLQIKNAGVTSAKILDGSILSQDIADFQISDIKLANNSVTTDKIEAGAVTGIKIAQSGATSGQVLKWGGSSWIPGDDNSGSGLWQQNESDIFYDTGRVGIGTASPTLDLTINKTGHAQQVIKGTMDALLHLDKGITSRYSALSFKDQGTEKFWVGLMQNNNFRISTRYDVVDGMEITSEGNTNFSGAVSVGGNQYNSGNLSLDGSQTIGGNATISGNAIVSGKIGIGKSPGSFPLEILGGTLSYAKFLHSGSGTANTDGFLIGTESSNTVWIWNYESGPVHLGTNNSYRITLRPEGNVGIGTTAPGFKLDVAGQLNINKGIAEDQALYVNGTEALWWDGTFFSWGYGSKYNYFADPITIATNADPGSYELVVNGQAAKTGGGSWSTWSDARLKKIHSAYERGLDEIIMLSPVSYNYAEGNPLGLETKAEFTGLVAQEVQEVFPEAVSQGTDGYLKLNLDPVNMALINSVKQLKKENDELRARLEKLEKAINK